MAKGDRTKAAEVVSLALTDTDGRWRNWGTWTIARRAIKALADEGWTLTPPAQRDGGDAYDNYVSERYESNAHIDGSGAQS